MSNTGYKFEYTVNTEGTDQTIVISNSIEEALNTFYDNLDNELPDGEDSFVSLDRISFKDDDGNTVKVEEPSILDGKRRT